MRDAERGVHDVVLEVDEARDVDVALGRAGSGEMADRLGRAVDVLVELQRRDGGVAAIHGDERVRHGAEPGGAPPFALLVRRDADRAAHERRVARAGLRLVRLMARAEHDDRLAFRRRDDLARVRRDTRSFGEGAEVQRLEVRERGVLPVDVHDRFATLGDVAVEQRADGKVAPARLPEERELVGDLEHLARERGVRVPPARCRQRGPVRVGPALGLEVPGEERVAPRPVAVPAGAHVEEREAVIRADDHGLRIFLEDLHGHAIAATISLEDELRAGEVDVALVSGADLLDGEPERLGPQPLSDDHHMLVSIPPSTCRLTPVM